MGLFEAIFGNKKQKEIEVHNYFKALTAYTPVFTTLGVRFFTITRDIVVERVKLELGSVSTLINDQPMDYGVELAKCQRYYQAYTIPEANMYLVPAWAWKSNNLLIVFPSTVSMRLSMPTIIISDMLQALIGGSFVTLSSPGYARNVSGFNRFTATASGAVLGTQYLLSGGAALSTVAFDAEL